MTFGIISILDVYEQWHVWPNYFPL